MNLIRRIAKRRVAAPEIASAEIGYHLGVPRLLLIEDDVDSLEMVALVLVAAGYAVDGAADKAAAKRALEKGAYDLVLADLLLGSSPLAASWQLIDELVDLARPTPFGLMTGWKLMPDDARDHGLVFVLRKPTSRGALISQLAETLKLPQLDDEHTQALLSYFKCIEQRAFGDLGALCTEDVTYRLPGSNARFANEVRGRGAFLAFTEQTFQTFQDPHFAVGAMRPLPGGAMVEYVGSWREGDAERVMPGAVMFEFRDGLISRINVRVDTDELR